MRIKVLDKQTQDVIGFVMTNQSLTIDQILSLSGFEWVEGDNETGWTVDERTFYSENNIILETEE